MLTRLAVLASAVAVSTAMFAPAAADTAQCGETNLRIYFAQDETALNQDAVQVLQRAERQVAECPYAELRVMLDASAPHARERGEAIVAAADGRAWDVARVERGEAAGAGPVYAEVLMTPRMLPVGEELPEAREAGA